MKRILYVGNKLKNSTPTSIHILGGNLENIGYNVIYIGTYKNYFIRFLEMKIKLLFISSKDDVVLIDTYSTLNFWYAILSSAICQIKGIKYIPILHGGNLEQKLKHNPLLSNFVFNSSYKNVAVSDFLFKTFKSYGYDVELIRNAINLENISFKKRVSFSPKLLWVRSFRNHYNPLMALEVLKNVKKKYCDASLCMVGPANDSSYEFFVKKAEEYDLTKSIEIKGLMSRKNWMDYSRNYDIFINTSNIDNTPFVILEAMALGLPVFSTDVGGIKYLIENKINGVLVNKNDFEKMSHEICTFLKNPSSLEKIISSSLNTVNLFSWKNNISLWKNILDDK